MNLKIQWVIDKLEHCKQNQCVALNLRFSYIRELPESLKDCTHIKHLNLSNNYIQQVPDYLLGFDDLQFVDLRYNPINKPIPKLNGIFIHSKHLKYVTNLQGVIGLRCGPPELNNIELPALKYLDCSSQNLSELNCHLFSNSIQKSIREINISDNPISTIVGLESLPNLECIVAKNTTFAPENPKIRIKYE